MTSLEWNHLAEKFYAFKVVADQYGFYVPELQGMEKSLELMRPYAGDNEKAKEIAQKKETVFISMPEWVGAKTPSFDENDELTDER